jgi:phage head maturation protease
MPNPYRLDFAFAVQPVAPGAQPAGAPVRFTGVAYSGGVIPSYGWLGDVAIDLATLQNPDAQNIPVLIDHCAEIENIAGKGNLSRQGHALHITGELTQATEAGRQIAALMAEGYPLQLSVGMQASLRETTEVTRQQQINGQNLSVKAVFEQARIIEVSFVPTGADPHTSAAQFSAKALEPVPQPATMKGVTMTRSPEDQALIDGLQAQITAFTDQVATLQTAQTAAAEATRTAELGALFTELGRDTPADIKPYIAMGADSFKAYAADLRANKPAPRDRALFSAQSTGKAANAKPEGADRSSALFAAVASISKKA